MPRNRRSRKYQPVLPALIQIVVKRFLTYWREAASKAIEAADLQIQLAPLLPSAAGQRRYWESIQQAIDWMISNVSHKQQWLLEVPVNYHNAELGDHDLWAQIAELLGVPLSRADQPATSLEQELLPSISRPTGPEVDIPAESVLPDGQPSPECSLESANGRPPKSRRQRSRSSGLPTG